MIEVKSKAGESHANGQLRAARVIERFNTEVGMMDPIKASLFGAVLQQLRTNENFDAPQVATCISTTRAMHDAINDPPPGDTAVESTGGESSALRKMLHRDSAESHQQCSAFQGMKPFKA